MLKLFSRVGGGRRLHFFPLACTFVAINDEEKSKKAMKKSHSKPRPGKMKDAPRKKRAAKKN